MTRQQHYSMTEMWREIEVSRLMLGYLIDEEAREGFDAEAAIAMLGLLSGVEP